MKLFNSLAILVSTSILALAGCGNSTIGGGTGGSGGVGGAGGGNGEGGYSNGDLCNGVPNPVSCETNGCPSGFACVKDADPSTCHSSICSCDAMGWVCTDDCGMNGSTCQPVAALCNNAPSPVSCETNGCPDGWTCTKDPDPTATCHPSSCSCDTSGWVCTADCGYNGSTCVMGL